MQYKLLKLTSGDTILATCLDETSFKENHIHVYDPVLLTPSRKVIEGNIIETFFMQPWNSLLDEEEMQIFTNNIVAVGELTGQGKARYLDYVSVESEAYEYEDLHDLEDIEEIAEKTKELAKRFLDSQNIEDEDNEEESSDGQIIH